MIKKTEFSEIFSKGLVPLIFRYNQAVEILHVFPFVCKKFESVVEYLLKKRLFEIDLFVLKNLGYCGTKKNQIKDETETNFPFVETKKESSERVLIKLVMNEFIILEKNNKSRCYVSKENCKFEEYVKLSDKFLFEMGLVKNYRELLIILTDDYNFDDFSSFSLFGLYSYELLRLMFIKFIGGKSDFKLSNNVYRKFMESSEWELLGKIVSIKRNTSRKCFYFEFFKYLRDTPTIKNGMELFEKLNEKYQCDVSENLMDFEGGTIMLKMEWKFMEAILTRKDKDGSHLIGKCKDCEKIITLLHERDEFLDFLTKTNSKDTVLVYYQPRFLIQQACLRKKNRDVKVYLALYDKRDDINRYLDFPFDRLDIKRIKLIMSTIDEIRPETYRKLMAEKKIAIAKLLQELCFKGCDEMGKMKMIMDSIIEKKTRKDGLKLLKIHKWESMECLVSLFNSSYFLKYKKMFEQILKIMDSNIPFECIKTVMDNKDDKLAGRMISKYKSTKRDVNPMTVRIFNECIKSELFESLKEFIKSKEFDNNKFIMADSRRTVNFLKNDLKLKDVTMNCGLCKEGVNILDKDEFKIKHLKGMNQVVCINCIFHSEYVDEKLV